MKTLLGVGRLSWNANERRCDRYGFVRLFGENDEDESIPLNGQELEGKKGKLLAEVIKARKSPHMGDLARGIVPTTPEVGEIIEFGEGEFTFEHCGEIHEKSEYEKQDSEMQDALLNQMLAAFRSMGAKVEIKHSGKESPQHQQDQGKENFDEEPEIYDMVGLKPFDGRKTDWLDPHKLYRGHYQIVKLYFEET